MSFRNEVRNDIYITSLRCKLEMKSVALFVRNFSFPLPENKTYNPKPSSTPIEIFIH